MRDELFVDPLSTEDAALVGWIDAHWEELAAFAWRSYVTVGRGLVLVTAASDGAMVVEYETPSRVAAEQEVWPDELQAAIAEYHPATEVLFLVEPEGAGTLIGMRATPPCISPWEAGHGDAALPVARSA